VASLDKAIPPGQEGKVTLKLNTGNRVGKLSKGATVITNDPEQSKTRITLSCTVKQIVSIAPNPRINLLGFEGDTIKHMVTITSFEEEPLEITDISNTVDDKIKYKLKTIEKGKKYTIEAQNRSKEVGSYRGQLVVKTTSKKKPHIVLPINGNLRKEVAVQPAKLFFGTINTAEENFDPQKLAKEVKVRDVRGDGFTVKKVKSSSKWIATEIEPPEENKKVSTLRVTLDKDTVPRGSFNETITVYTSYKKTPLVVEVKGEVL